MSRRGFRNQRAFSLIESLVVMLIIILLATILIPGLLGRGREKPILPVPKSPTKEKSPEKPKETDEPAPVSNPEQETPVPELESVTRS